MIGLLVIIIIPLAIVLQIVLKCINNNKMSNITTISTSNTTMNLYFIYFSYSKLKVRDYFS